MALALEITVKESIADLKKLQRTHGMLIGKRIYMLIIIKQNENTLLSKRALSDLTGINHNSIVKWRNMYLKDGIQALLTHGRKGGYKKSVFSSEEHHKIEEKLNDPKNGIRGYKELLDWVKQEFRKEIKYITLLKYSERNFGSKIKVARKSHVKKDDELVESFKKTSI